jgi:hypothetical protein
MHGRTTIKIIHIHIYGLKIRRKDDSIEMDLTEIRLGGTWIGLM